MTRTLKLKTLLVLVALALVNFMPSRMQAEEGNKQPPIIVQEQGSFLVGGSKTIEPGAFDLSNALKPQGQTLHGDHLYAFYQIPVETRRYPLIFLHGAGESKKTWETTPDGREGFQNIFLRKNYSVYLLDQPRRGDAGRSSVGATIQPTHDEQFWFTQFRLGNYPDYFPNVQFPRDAGSLEQFFRQMTPNTGAFDASVIADAISALFDKTGQGILITHSQGGGPGWVTAIKNANVKAVVAYEPYSGFVFPKGELPPSIKSAGLFGDLKGVEISPAEFNRLTKIPIIVYYGDNIADRPTTVWNQDHWRAGLEMARAWAATINKHGGDATVVHLPEVGIMGNTHFAFADLNNVQVAEELTRWLKQKGLDAKAPRRNHP